MNIEEEREKLLQKGVNYLNKLDCDWEDRDLQELLFHYNQCKEDLPQLKKAISIMSGITRSKYVDPWLLSELKELNKKED